jgi:3'(2'), 5'-bisphosphate nucleotidase
MSPTLAVDGTAISAMLQTLGRDLLAWRGDATARHLHSRQDFKTDADRRADRFIKEHLARLHPGVPVLSEEDAEHAARRPDCYWLIDPIDGTASWYDGFEGFVTQVALIEGGRPRFGAIHSPATGRTWTAQTGGGAYLDGRPLARLECHDRCVLVDNTPAPHGVAADLMRLLPATGYRESGSLGLKAVLVADGTVDLFVKRVTVRDWDMAPVAVILGETGGCLALPDGSPFPFTGEQAKPGVIVARDTALLTRTVAALAALR